MKKLVCFLLAGAMASTGVCAFAETPKVSAASVIAAASGEKALSLEGALAKVKSKIDIPAEFSNFNSSTNQNGDTVSYSFHWSTEDGGKSISISCDGLGRIDFYWRYQNSDDESSRLGNIDKETALSYAESFLRKAMPETFISENDKPVYNPSGYYGYISGNGTSYSFSFIRHTYGVDVSSNTVYLSLKNSGDSFYVENMNIDYDYDAKFEEPGTLLENPDQTYKEVFPLELVYESDYGHTIVPLDEKNKEDSSEVKTVLKYRIDNPDNEYLSAYTGEKVSEKAYMGAFREGMSENALADSGKGGDFASEFTPQELQEIQRVANLKTASEIEASLRKLPDIKMQNLKLDSSNVYKSGDGDDDYTMSLAFRNPNSDKYDGMYVQANAKTGEITSISKACRYDEKIEKLSESQLALAKSKADAFIRAAAPDKAAEYEMSYSSDNGGVAHITYTRMVNGIRFIDDNLNVEYNVNDGSVCGYYINYTKNAVFADAKNVVSAEDAYAELLKVSPLKKLYIRAEDGIYKLCFAANYNNYIEIDATTGKPFDYAAERTGEYSDISGHWCEKTIQKLADVGIALPGDKFNPDEAITGKDLWSLFDMALCSYPYYKIVNDTLVCDTIKVIPDSAKDAPVTREDACVYLASMAGYSKIAKHYDIFRTNFADSDQISPDKIGYAAIMSALGAVSGSNGGSGSMLRPKDNITRAEAAVMLYNYLINN